MKEADKCSLDSNMAENSKGKNVDIFEKPGAKAPVWQFFGVRNQIENNSAVCKINGTDVPTKSGTTSCMLSHLKVHHSLRYEEIHKNKRKLPGSNTESASTLKCGRTESNYFNTSEDNFVNSDLDLDNLIDKTDLDSCVTADKNSLIIDLVENARVTEIFQNLISNLTLPNNTLFNQVSFTDMYEKLRKQIEFELKEVQFVAVSTDEMKDFHFKSYFNVTCRFITSDCELKPRTLQTFHIR